MILTTAVRDALADQIDTLVNVSGPGSLLFETSGDVEVATIVFQNPAFGSAASGVITLLGVTLSDTSATGGTTVQATGEDGASLNQWELTVGTGGTEIIISSTIVGATDQVDLTGEAAPPFERVPRLDLHLVAAGGPKILLASERPIEPGRRHLQSIASRDRVRGVEMTLELARYPSAQIDRHSSVSLLRIDRDPELPRPGAARERHVHELVAGLLHQRLDQLPHLLRDVPIHNIASRNRKSGPEPTFDNTQHDCRQASSRPPKSPPRRGENRRLLM